VTRKDSEERSYSYEINKHLKDARQQETNFASGAPTFDDTRNNQEIVFLLNSAQRDPTRLSILKRDDENHMVIEERNDSVHDDYAIKRRDTQNRLGYGQPQAFNKFKDLMGKEF
jgi:hypothetical protein